MRGCKPHYIGVRRFLPSLPHQPHSNAAEGEPTNVNLEQIVMSSLVLITFSIKQWLAIKTQLFHLCMPACLKQYCIALKCYIFKIKDSLSLLYCCFFPYSWMPDLFWEGLSLLQFWAAAKRPCLTFYNGLWNKLQCRLVTRNTKHNALSGTHLIKRAVEYVVSIKKVNQGINDLKKEMSEIPSPYVAVSSFSAFTAAHPLGEEELGQSCSGDSNTEAPLFGPDLQCDFVYYKCDTVQAFVCQSCSYSTVVPWP